MHLFLGLLIHKEEGGKPFFFSYLTGTGILALEKLDSQSETEVKLSIWLVSTSK